jgi:hypothetical protein
MAWGSRNGIECGSRKGIEWGSRKGIECGSRKGMDNIPVSDNALAPISRQAEMANNAATPISTLFLTIIYNTYLLLYDPLRLVHIKWVFEHATNKFLYLQSGTTIN